MNGRNKVVVLICIIVTSIAVIAGGVFAYLYFSDSDSKNSASKSRSSNKNRNDDNFSGTVMVLEPSSGKASEKELNAAAAVLRTRLDALGYTEAIAQVEDGNIELKYPKEVPEEDIIDSITSVAHLTFRDYEGNVLLESKHIAKAYAEFMNLSTGDEGFAVILEFTDEGAKIFARETERISKLPEGSNSIVIYVDDSVICAPRVNQQITGNECFIDGDFTEESAKTLAAQIQGGKLPFALTVCDTYTVSD